MDTPDPQPDNPPRPKFVPIEAPSVRVFGFSRERAHRGIPFLATIVVRKHHNSAEPATVRVPGVFQVGNPAPVPFSKFTQFLFNYIKNELKDFDPDLVESIHIDLKPKPEGQGHDPAPQAPENF